MIPSLPEAAPSNALKYPKREERRAALGSGEVAGSGTLVYCAQQGAIKHDSVHLLIPAQSCTRENKG